MKLAFCLFKYFPFGGLQRDFLRIAEECVQRGHSVDVYTMEWDGLLPQNLTINVLPPRGWQNHSRIKHFIQDVQAALRTQKYDLVIGFNKMPGLDVYYAADSCYQAKTRKKHGVLYRLTPRYRQMVALEKNVFARQAKTEILLLSDVQQVEFEYYYQTESSRFHLLPPGISRDRIAPLNAGDLRRQTRQQCNLSEKDLMILLVGSGFKTKGLDRALLGFANLPADLKNRAHLFVIGADDAAPFLQQAKNLNIADRVKFLGGRDDVPHYLLAADLLVHPAYNENTGTVLLEAIVSGLPVLTTDVCGYAGYVRSAKAGHVLASPFNQVEFNQTLQSMLLSPERTTWQQNGLRFAKRADIYSLIERAVDIIESRKT